MSGILQGQGRTSEENQVAFHFKDREKCFSLKGNCSASMRSGELIEGQTGEGRRRKNQHESVFRVWRNNQGIQ